MAIQSIARPCHTSRSGSAKYRWYHEPKYISCSGREPMGAIWTKRLATRQPRRDTSICCSGREPMGAIGTNILAVRQPQMDTFISCSGREPMGAIGTQRLAVRRPKTDTSMSCSGQEPMGVLAMLELVLGLLAGAAMTWSMTGLMQWTLDIFWTMMNKTMVMKLTT
jgi:hypothetical protein